MTTTIPIKPFCNLMKYLFLRHSVFGINSLEEFKIFIEGYYIAILTNGIVDVGLEKFKVDFDEYII